MKALPWLWLGVSAAWAALVFVTEQPAWPLAVWVATTLGPITVVKSRLDSKVATEKERSRSHLSPTPSKGTMQ